MILRDRALGPFRVRARIGANPNMRRCDVRIRLHAQAGMASTPDHDQDRETQAKTGWLMK